MSKKSFRILLGLAVLVLASIACNFSASTAKISAAEMARDSEGTQPTTTFAPEDTFFCNVTLDNAPDGTTVKAVWTAVAVEGAEPNLMLDETQLESGSGVLNFQMENSNLWPAGAYKVDLYLNEKLDRTIEFAVQ
jgi:hypothetical protein